LVDAIAALFPEDSFVFPERQSPSPSLFAFQEEEMQALPSAQEESPRIMMIYAKTFPKEAGMEQHERESNTNSDDSYCTSESDSALEAEEEQANRGEPRAAPSTGHMPKSVQRSMWSPREHQKFLDALKKFNISCNRETKEDGRMYAGLGPHVADLIAMDIGTRTVSQVRSHAQKYFQRLSRQRSRTSPVQE